MYKGGNVPTPDPLNSLRRCRHLLSLGHDEATGDRRQLREAERLLQGLRRRAAAEAIALVAASE